MNPHSFYPHPLPTKHTPTCYDYAMEQWETGKLIGEAREKAGLSKIEAAKRSGVSTSFWYRIENGYYKEDGNIKKTQVAPETLISASLVVGLDPVHILKTAGIKPRADLTELTDLRHKITLRLNKLYLAELRLVDNFLGWVESESAQIQNLSE